MVVSEWKESDIYQILETVLDPEVPVLSVVDLGIVRKVHKQVNVWMIDICPTYSGCPALDVIAVDIKFALAEKGLTNTRVQYVLNETWTTDWISQAGRDKLQAYGIAPPQNPHVSDEERVVPCPQCQSRRTEIVSVFGSTACKSLYKCLDCLEPFDYFKCK